jgi:hypothetical protein
MILKANSYSHAVLWKTVYKNRNWSIAFHASGAFGNYTMSKLWDDNGYISILTDWKSLHWSGNI